MSDSEKDSESKDTKKTVAVALGHDLVDDRPPKGVAGGRDTLEARGAWANVKPMPHRLDPPEFSNRLYGERNLVERFFNKLKHFRAVATRYDKRNDNSLASVKLALIRIGLRFKLNPIHHTQGLNT